MLGILWGGSCVPLTTPTFPKLATPASFLVGSYSNFYSSFTPRRSCCDIYLPTGFRVGLTRPNWATAREAICSPCRLEKNRGKVRTKRRLSADHRTTTSLLLMITVFSVDLHYCIGRPVSEYNDDVWRRKKGRSEQQKNTKHADSRQVYNQAFREAL